MISPQFGGSSMRDFATGFAVGAALLASCLFAAPAAAQHDLVGIHDSMSDVSDLPFSRSSSEIAAMGMMLQLRNQKVQGNHCFETGCLFIVNQTSDYDAVGLYLDVGSPDPHDAPVWGPNLLREKLRPHLARWTYKAGDSSMCALTTMVVLRHRRTGEEVRSDGELSLCRSPRVDSALRINVNMPKVTLEEPGSD